MVKTTDEKEFPANEFKLMGSFKKASCKDTREMTKPAKVGEFPVFVEQQGDYRLFTYSKKIAEIT